MPTEAELATDSRDSQILLGSTRPCGTDGGTAASPGTDASHQAHLSPAAHFTGGWQRGWGAGAHRSLLLGARRMLTGVFLCFPGTSLNLAGETAETSPNGRENKSRSAKTRRALRQWCPWHDSGVEQRSAGSLALPAPHPRPFASSPPYLPHHVQDLF